jgi:ABC-type molybdate transport system substrate-binding protein
MLNICVTSPRLRGEGAPQKCVMLPLALAVGAEYRLIVMKDAPAGALAFAHYILSELGQSILARHGFDPSAL